ncbi:DMT family transporter [Caniella muris]|uniref:DMT family transporter n=1 Tax=Caniella muris TaxID=2941502 RepID=UPI00203E869B|nr:SMR family transporter [Caniella muris]
MHWLVLVLSGCLEAVWAVVLDRSCGFTQVVPTVFFAMGLAGSMLGLSFALRELPVGVVYGVWVGVGATLTVVWGAVTGEAPINGGQGVCLVLLVGSIVGLKALGGH